MQALEVLESGDQPVFDEAVIGAQCQALLLIVLEEGGGTALEGLEHATDQRQIGMRLVGQLDAIAAAHKQADREEVFQLLDSLTDGALGNAQFGGGAGQAAEAGGGLEGGQGIEGGQALSEALGRVIGRTRHAELQLD